MKRFILVRHGETDENRRGVVQGWLPGTLSIEGERQAALLAQRFHDSALDAIVSSDLTRARLTAEAIAAVHPRAQIVLEPALRERNFGGLQGRIAADVTADAADSAAHAAGLEPIAVFRARVRRAFDDIVARDDADTILVVSHGGPLRLLQYLLAGTLDLPPAVGFMHPGAVSEFERTGDEHWRPVRLDCRDHLGAGRWSDADQRRILSLLEQRAAQDNGGFRKAAVEAIDGAVQTLQSEGTAVPAPLPPGRRMTIVEHASFLDGDRARDDLTVDDTLLADLDRIERLLRG